MPRVGAGAHEQCRTLSILPRDAGAANCLFGLFAGEQGLQPLALLVGEHTGAGVQGPPGGIQRVALAAPVPAGVLEDPATAPIQGSTGEAHDVKRIPRRDRIGQLLGGGGLEPGEGRPSRRPRHASRHDSSRPARHCLKACLERPETMSSSLAGPVPSRMPVRSMMTVTYFSPRRV